MDLNLTVKKMKPNLWMLLAILGLSSIAAPTLAQTAPRTRQAALPASAPVRDEGYLLGSGDKVKIDVFGVPEYTGEYQVMADGRINLPLAGSVSVQGLTVNQASNKIKSAYSEWLTRPVITVSLTTTRPIQVAMSGEVARPGTYTTTLNDTGIPTLSRMVQMAGGLKQSADLKQVEIRRRMGAGGGMQTLRVDLAQLLSSGDLSQDIQLRDGDSVIIPAATALNFQDSSQLATSSLGASFDRPISVIVAGEVNRPGPHSVQGEKLQVQNPATPGLPGQPNVVDKVKAPTVTRALQIAGGITQQANIRDIIIKRTTNSGAEQTLKVNLMALIQAGDARQDITLQEGDRVIVPQATTLSPADSVAIARASFSPDVITVNVVGEVEKPGAIQIPPNTTLNQALLAAGGFNGRARRGRVNFIRLQNNGTIERRDIPVDLSRGIDPQNNPVLQANDTIVIGKDGFKSFIQGVGNFLGPAFGVVNLFR